MTKFDSRVGLKIETAAKASGEDGWSLDLGQLDNSFRCWRQIVRWNWHYRHWGALRLNARHLFTKVIWRKMWRHSA